MRYPIGDVKGIVETVIMVLLRKGVSSIRPILCRFQHTGSNSSKPEVHKSRISQHLTLRSVSKSPSKKSRDLVLFYEWLYPNAKALDKYCMLYHELGLDVLTIHGQLKHFISPSQSVKLSQEILDYLRNERNPKEDRYIAHTASIGAYNFTTCSMRSTTQSEFGFFRNNIRGQIFDSIVAGSHSHMSTGIFEAFDVPRLLRKPLHGIMDSFYKVTKKQTKDVYDKMVEHFWNSVLKVPTLVIYSENDPMCDTLYLQENLSRWRRDFPDFDVTSVSWKKSVHAAHLKEHPKDYIREWRT